MVILFILPSCSPGHPEKFKILNRPVKFLADESAEMGGRLFHFAEDACKKALFSIRPGFFSSMRYLAHELH
jgi:hypothetical protein